MGRGALFHWPYCCQWAGLTLTLTLTPTLAPTLTLTGLIVANGQVFDQRVAAPQRRLNRCCTGTFDLGYTKAVLDQVGSFLGTVKRCGRVRAGECVRACVRACAAGQLQWVAIEQKAKSQEQRCVNAVRSVQAKSHVELPTWFELRSIFTMALLSRSTFACSDVTDMQIIQITYWERMGSCCCVLHQRQGKQPNGYWPRHEPRRS